MTRKKFWSQIGEAGKFCIDRVTKDTYQKWFDSQTLFEDKKLENLVCAINSYNEELDRLEKSWYMDEECKNLVRSYYVVILSKINILDDIGYYDVDKYGDIESFGRYCWSCWNTMLPIDFAEYEKIRAFFDGRKETKHE